jgi:hypothetical protein
MKGEFMKMKSIGWMFFFASLASVAIVCAATKIAVPQTGGTYSVGQLFDLINTNNPAKTSRFLILTTKGSQGIDLSAYNGQSVVLNQDPARIAQLVAGGALTSATKAKYQAIMLYFTLPTAPAPFNTYKYYLNDPNPGKRVKAGNVIRDPAASIIAKWNI